MKIYVTGSPGTGKTTLSKSLQKLLIKFSNFNVFEIRDILEQNQLLEEYEKKRDTSIFDLTKSMLFIQNMLLEEESFILAGPLLPFNLLRFDFIIVLTCSKREKLINRLSNRNYKISKIEENVEAELLGEVLGNTLDWISEYKLNPKPNLFDTCSLNIDEIIQQFISQIEFRKKN